MPSIRPSAILGVRQSNYQGIANLGNAVIAAMTGNANFTTPTPGLVALQGFVTDVENAILVWGPVGNRGSHAELLDLRNKAAILYAALLAEAEYVTNTAILAAGNDYTLMSTIISSSGFGVKNNPVPQGVLGVPQNFHQVFSNSINPTFVALDWKKPLGLTSPSNVKSYQVFRGTTNVFSTASFIGTTTKTKFTDTTPPAATIAYYFVRGINAAGNGVETAALQVNTTAL